MFYNAVLVSVVQQNEPAIRIHTSPLFFGFLSHHRELSRVPCATRRSSLVICFILGSVYMPIAGYICQ